MTVEFMSLASFGFLETVAAVPTAPTITSIDNKDGTGVEITLSGYDVGTSNTLYLAANGEAFISQGSAWVADEKALSLSNGVYWAFVESVIGDVFSVSPTIRVLSTNEQSGAADNIQVAIKIMVHDAVYWPPAAIWSETGIPVPEDPIQISCRWEEKSEQYIDAEGTEQVSQAIVVVDRDLKTTGILMRGTLLDIVDPVNPKSNPDSWEIKSYSKLPDFKGSKYFRKAFL